MTEEQLDHKAAYPLGSETQPTYRLTRSRCPVRAVQCRRDNKAEVDSFLRSFRQISHHYRPNEHGGWQGIHDSRGLVEQVWLDSWLVEVPETGTYKQFPESRLRDFEVPDA
jgi:hypothetical protein